MNYRSSGFIKVCVALVILGSLMLACGDYSIKLPGNYSVVRIYAGAFVISGPDNGIVINANVDSCKVYGKVVVGHVLTADLEPEKSYSKPGYFIIDTERHTVKQSLDRLTWLGLLKEGGIKGEPALSKPSRFSSNG